MLKERSKSNFQIRNKKIKTQELRTKTQDVQNKHENESLLY
jgi:hypothetical protein